MLRHAVGLMAIAAVAIVAPLHAEQAGAVTHEIMINNFVFAPERVIVHQGDTIKWVNHDVVRHNATAADKSWATSALAPGGDGSIMAATIGTFTYICTRHPEMKGTIVVEPAK